MQTKIVPADELKSSLCAKDYVGGPEEPDTSSEDAYIESLRQMDPAMAAEMREIDKEMTVLLENTPYEWDTSDLTVCCGVPVFESDDPNDGTVPQCSKCGEPRPTLRNPEPQEELE
jgi:hypothetical protein